MRKNITRSKLHTEVINLRISKDVKDKLKLYSEKTNTTMTEIITYLLKNHIKRYEKKNNVKLGD